ncbi:FAD-binding protein [Georgenia sp. H159]|uniref:FAD-binding protein n=1 Tax=Georgenia sp. H159 TaxID=3076115 RepID=UPI002D767F1E|nr:FAD-binding protein [Georgenia sp. H159]
MTTQHRRTAAEVQAAVRAARRDRRPVLVRSGGWHLGLGPLRDEPVSIDLRELRDVTREGATAWVGPGLSSAAAASLLGDSGFPLGHAPEVGVGGYLLSGGNGWNGGAWGAAGDRVVAVEVVTPDGELRVVDDGSDPGLMTLVRGAGPLFPGVVTRFRLALADPVRIARQGITFPADAAAALGEELDQLAPACPPGLELTVFLRPGEADGPRVTLAATAFDATDAEEQLSLLGTLTTPGEPTAVSSFSSLGALLATLSSGPVPPAAFHQTWTHAPYATTLPLLVDALRAPPSAVTSVLVARAPVRTGDLDSVYTVPAPVSVAAYAHTPHPTGRTWCRATIRALPTAGHFIGEADLGLVSPLDCFGTVDRARLPGMLAAVDPDGWFRPMEPGGHRA